MSGHELGVTRLKRSSQDMLARRAGKGLVFAGKGLVFAGKGLVFALAGASG